MKISKKSIAFLLASSLCSCSMYDSDNIAPGYKAAYKGISSYFFPKDNEFITPQVVNQIPYASALIKLGKGTSNLIILESINNDTYNYVSSDSIYLSIKNGRIVSTSGLSNNLQEFIEPFSITNWNENNKDDYVYNVFYSYDQPELIRLKINASLKYIGKEEVDLFTQKKLLRRYEEKISNFYLRWNKKNIFWLDEEGYVWKSIQHISPKLPQFEIVITKKPAE